MARPFVWYMIQEAVKHLGGKATYSQIKQYIRDTYGDVNENTINAQAIVCTVNQPSRVHYPENQKARGPTSKYDFLYSTGRGQVELYDPAKHGIWAIRKNDEGKLIIVKQDTELAVSGTTHDEIAADNAHAEANDIAIAEAVELPTPNYLFPIESHLRDFLARNLETLDIANRKLQLYVDDQGRDGVEYPTGVGPIDILAVDDAGNFYVFELKVSRGADTALGQILRYMGWIKHHRSGISKVHGIIVAKSVSDKLRNAASMIPDVSLFEYELQFALECVQID